MSWFDRFRKMGPESAEVAAEVADMRFKAEALREKMEDPYEWLDLHRPRMWGFRQMCALLRDFDERLTILEKGDEQHVRD